MYSITSSYFLTPKLLVLVLHKCSNLLKLAQAGQGEEHATRKRAGQKASARAAHRKLKNWNTTGPKPPDANAPPRPAVATRPRARQSCGSGLCASAREHETLNASAKRAPTRGIPGAQALWRLWTRRRGAAQRRAPSAERRASQKRGRQPHAAASPFLLEREPPLL